VTYTASQPVKPFLTIVLAAPSTDSADQTTDSIKYNVKISRAVPQLKFLIYIIFNHHLTDHPILPAELFS